MAVIVCVCVYCVWKHTADRGCVRLSALAGQSAEDAPLRHLQAGGDRWNSGQRGR